MKIVSTPFFPVKLLFSTQAKWGQTKLRSLFISLYGIQILLKLKHLHQLSIYTNVDNVKMDMGWSPGKSTDTSIISV